MGKKMNYFFDSYELIEIFKGSINYSKYQDVVTVKTYFNL